jgi:hypothetical protein
MDSGADTGLDSGMSDEEMELLDLDVKAMGDDGSFNRNNLMKLTGKELAKMAQPYSTKTLAVLEKTAKAKLCDLILAKEEKKPKEEKTHARAGRTTSETEQFIQTAVSLLDVMKRSRDEEPLNAMAKDIFTKQAVVYADAKVAADEMNVDKANTALFAISASALLFDGLIGFKNAPTLFSKVKNKFFPKADKKEK